mmetsp:Transcript_210/g.325  ORF Transcript_210/g.325 Transcript_210/m.325 type:complete len:705 (-) Transcript_210:921-3035(-)
MRSHGSKISFFIQGLGIVVILLLHLVESDAFSSPILFNALQRHHHHYQPCNLEARVKMTQMLSKVNSYEHDDSFNDSHKKDEDEILLKQVPASMLKDLCAQNGLSTLGTKEEVLLRLRAFAQDKAEIDKERRRMQKQRIERGVDDEQGNGKAKYKIISNDDEDLLDDDDDDVDGVFYFSLPGKISDAQNKTIAKVTSTTITKTMNPQIDSRGTITSPPPPPGVKANENGEIAVTTYSSTDQNDLTGIAAHHAASSGNDRALAGGYSRTDDFGADPLRSPENTLAGGPFGDQSGAKRKKSTDKQFDEACDVISELVYSLLSMTGAPGFQEQFSEGVTPFLTVEEEKMEGLESTPINNQLSNNVEFVGFDPSRVPTHLITQASTFLRVRNGEALRKVLNEVELQAIGFDGINGDDKRKGGGHYLEVTKVGTFLEGFRKAEIRRIARETISMLIDQLVTGGVKGLDQMLMTMARGSEDTGDSGELNDSLVKYLDDAIRDQEKKVQQLLGQQGILSESKVSSISEDLNDVLSELWNVTTDEDGKTVESLDPNDPRVKKAIEREIRDAAQNQKINQPTHPSKILLNMLILLKERIKAEAAFSNDVKGRNLRILAYCLHAKDDRERESIIMENLGTNLDKLDSFSQLVASSIDYAESTSNQLQPAKSGSLNIHLLKNIKELVGYLKDKQAWKASGVTAMEQNRYLPRGKN